MSERLIQSSIPYSDILQIISKKILPVEALLKPDDDIGGRKESSRRVVVPDIADILCRTENKRIF